MNDNQHSNDPLLAMLASFEGHVREIVSKAEREEAACRAAMDGNCSRHTADNDRISKQLTALEQEGENASATCKKAASAILSRLHAMRDHYAADAQNPSTLETELADVKREVLAHFGKDTANACSAPFEQAREAIESAVDAHQAQIRQQQEACQAIQEETAAKRQTLEAEKDRITKENRQVKSARHDVLETWHGSQKEVLMSVQERVEAAQGLGSAIVDYIEKSRKDGAGRAAAPGSAVRRSAPRQSGKQASKQGGRFTTDPAPETAPDITDGKLIAEADAKLKELRTNYYQTGHRLGHLMNRHIRRVALKRLAVVALFATVLLPIPLRFVPSYWLVPALIGYAGVYTVVFFWLVPPAHKYWK